jgi:hypothetical protein
MSNAEQIDRWAYTSTRAVDEFAGLVAGEYQSGAELQLRVAHAAGCLRGLSNGELGLLAVRVMVELLVARGEIVLRPEAAQDLLRAAVAADDKIGD